MGKIVVSEIVSLDGVVEDPTGEEGFRHGGWFNEFGAKDHQAWAEVGLAEALGAEALLMGRRSDEYFGARWPSRTGEWADRLNGLPKYVVSSTLEDPVWDNATVVNGDVVSEVAKLKQRARRRDRRDRQPSARPHADGARPRRRGAADGLPGRARGRRAPVRRRPATRRPCASSTPGPSVTAWPT